MVAFTFTKLGETAPEIAARQDYEQCWQVLIAGAKSKRKKSVSNFGWWSCGRSDPEYIAALQELLGLEYTVEYVKGQWGGQWTKISW